MLFNLKRNRFFKTRNLSAMRLAFLINCNVIQINVKVLNQFQKQTKNTVFDKYNKNLKLEETHIQQLDNIILHYITKEKNFLVKNEKIKILVFILVKQNFNNQPWILSPNLLYFLALNLIKTDKSLIAKFNRKFPILSKKLRISFLTCGYVAIYYLGIGYPHGSYYKMPIEPIGIWTECRTNLITKVIRKVDQTELYTSSLERSDILESKMKLSIDSRKSKIDLMKNRQYRKSQLKSRIVRFDDFRKKDSVLKYWNLPKVNLDEFQFKFKIH